MGRALEKLPLLVSLIGLGATMMLVPAVHAAAVADFYVARVFFYGALLFLSLAGFLALATAHNPPGNATRAALAALVGFFVLVPAMLAVPLHQAVGNTSYLNAYLEMVSALTTTGATVFDDPARLPDSVHLWRALVGWLGGFFVLVSAVAILAPLALGGFEVHARISNTQSFGAGLRQIRHVAEFTPRVWRFALQILPVYGGLTAVLWLALIIAGERPLVGFCHALSTLSTSGISPVGGLQQGVSGTLGEVMVALFLVFALSRVTFSPDRGSGGGKAVWTDPEIRMACAIVVTVPLLLFARHWVGAYEVDEEMNFAAGLASLWGSFFTVLSFLTTTGFESAGWAGSRDWSGLHTPGLILMGLALVGGGVATTAGGAKLLRVHALYRHGLRELDKLVYPHSVGGAGGEARHIRRHGAYMAWVFFMLMTMTLAIVTMALALTGIDFESVMVLAIAALTTTGPITSIAASEPLSLALLPAPAKIILGGAMVLGRLETLAMIALFSPDFWRR